MERAEATALDAADPLRHYRDEFVIDDPDLVYLDGNSLGRLTRSGQALVVDALERQWASRLIRSWQERWVDLPFRLGDLIGTGLLGAEAGETLVTESTTVSLYKVLSAALDARPDRDAIVIEEANFPTDRYLVESLGAHRGLEIRWIPDRGVDGVALADLEPLLDDRVALVLLSHVDYRSAAVLDMAALTAATHRVDALSVWDLCHSAGAVPLDLTACGVDLAVGCTYKYLNGGPGAPAFTFVRAGLQQQLRQPIWGWFSRRDMFEMEPGYEPRVGIGGWQTGTPGVLSMVAIEAGVTMIVEAGIERLRGKSLALTTLAVDLYDDWLAARGWDLASPRAADRRGSHVTVTRPGARDLLGPLEERGVVPDYRRPDGIRLGMAPLTTRFTDVYDGLAALRDLSR